jgi:hypothetical protein
MRRSVGLQAQRRYDNYVLNFSTTELRHKLELSNLSGLTPHVTLSFQFDLMTVSEVA